MARMPRWKSKLLERVRDADRLVAWDHAATSDGRDVERCIHFEVTDSDAIRDLLDRIEIDEDASTGRCVCAGSPHVDLFSGKELLATLDLHHGIRVRWDGEWPADAELTRPSSFDVCDWFRERGLDEPWSELQRHLNRSLAWQRRAVTIRKILPEEVSSRFLEARSEEEVLSSLRSVDEAPRTIARWCLEILGCDNASWELIDEITHANELAAQVMPLLGRDACSAALRHSVLLEGDRVAGYGAARVLFFFGGWEVFSRQVLNEALPAIVRLAIRHPRRRNRQYAMWVLSQLDGGDEPLRWILEGKSRPEPLRPDEATEPEGHTYARNLVDGEPVHASDRAYAAWLLGRIGAGEVRQTIEFLAADADGPDKLALQKALKALGH